jgi:hypothetical protein
MYRNDLDKITIVYTSLPGWQGQIPSETRQPGRKGETLLEGTHDSIWKKWNEVGFLHND